MKQAAVADRLLLTKVDIADAPKLDELKHRLQHLNPGATAISISDGEIDPNAILNAGLYNPETKTADVKRWLHEEAYEGGHDHGHGTMAIMIMGTTTVTTSTSTATASRTRTTSIATTTASRRSA